MLKLLKLRITSTNSSTGCTSYIIRIIISRCGNATSIGAVAVNDAMCFSGTALRCMPGRSHSPGRGPGLPLFSGRHELILMAPCNERFCIGLFWMYEQDRIGEIGKRADAPRRCMWRWFSVFLQPHFGGSCACHRCHGVGEPTPC